KLALVVAGRADQSILDSYEAERVPVAERLLDTTDRAFRVVVSEGWLAGLLRTRILARIAAFALGIKQVQAFAFRTVSQTGIHYRSSALSMSAGGLLPQDAPQPGDRFPWLHLRFAAGGAVLDSFAELDDEHFHLLAFGQAAPEATPAFGELLRIHAVP